MALLRAVVRAVINDPFSSGVSIATNSSARAAAVSFVSQNDSVEWLPWQPYTEVPPVVDGLGDGGGVGGVGGGCGRELST
jgi:hypothetical protein